MNRWKAAGIHFCLSLLVVGSIAALVLLQWYPYWLWRIAGLDRLFMIMLGIDVVAGPLLTLIVYNRAKPELRRDLATIALLQLAFLGYGLYTTCKSRPVFLVGATNQLVLVFANELDAKVVSQAPTAELRRLSWTGPRLVGTRMPVDPLERSRIVSDMMSTGLGIERTPKYYFAYARAAPDLLAHASPVDGVAKIPDRDVRATGRSRAELRWLPVSSARGFGVILIDARNAQPLRTLALDANDLP